MQHWLSHWLGLDNGSGALYLFWSGFFGAVEGLGGLAIIGGVIFAARHHNCHVKGCWRFKKHPVEGTPYVVCRKHHPTVTDAGPTHQDVLDAHAEAAAAKLDSQSQTD